ncbi:hypothetical protein scyTo_0023267, partial [Scyliorhinus torazame]|nr:hypothetical protein [Scyliorhinus torazame]
MSQNRRLVDCRRPDDSDGRLQFTHFERFSECYKPVYKIMGERFMRGLYQQLITELQRSIQAEVSEISEHGQFERALPKLDKMEQESEARSEPA